MKWTTEQKRAIETRGGKVIVSAAAGSGKTAVLSERIIDYILKGGSIDKLLVVTFTNLAAGEMKERIKKNIHNALIKDPNNPHLQEQILLIEHASIMTMDAFYNKLIKENFAYLNISPNFQIIDEIQYNVIKNDVAKEIIEKNLQKGNDINDLLDNFCDYKNGTTIEELLINFNEYVNKIPMPDVWLDKLMEVYNVNNFNDSIWCDILFKELKDDFTSFQTLYLDIFEEIKLDEILLEKVTLLFEQEKHFIERMLKYIEKRDLNNIINATKKMEWGRYPSIRGYKDHPTSVKFKNIRANLKELINNYNVNILKFVESFAKDINIIEPLIEKLIKMTKEYRKELKTIREANNFYSFDDIPHLVLKLLVEDYNFETGEIKKTKHALKIMNTFDEILIDEFQDTNLVQNLIFKCLSKDETNLFIVGDVKQSIYAFRSARPDLLINEKNNAFNDKFPRIINLSKNFRSRKEVLDFTNYLFSKIMSTSYGDVNYDDTEKLNLGANYEENSDNFVELHLLSKLSENDEVNDELSNQEKEAIVITKRIKKLFDENYQVFDAKKGQFRPLKQSDIAILLRSPGDFGNILRDTLVKNGIDVYTDRTPIYFNNYEIKLIIALLKIINNPYDDLSIVAVLRSPLFAFDPDLLVEIRKVDKENYLYNNLLQMQNNTLIKNFLDKLHHYQEKAKVLRIDKLLNYLYNDTKIIAIISAMEEGQTRVKNLLEMINHTQKFIKNNNSSLHDFIDYIDTLINNNYSLEGVNPVSEKDSVLITTIHQSKGLEFPVVILPKLDKQFNLNDLKQDILMDNDYYLGFKLRDSKAFLVNSNIILELIKKEKKNKQLSEELRILYVALTRAKEKLIMTGIVNNLSNKITNINSLIGNDDKIPIYYLKQVNNMLDWILPVVIKHKSGKDLRELSDIDTKLYNDEISLNIFLSDINNIMIENKVKEVKKSEKINYKEIDDALNYEYPYPILMYKQKMSVSELKFTNDKILKPSFIEPQTQFMVGTTYHKILEHLPFAIYEFNNLKEEINKLINQNIITKDEANAINLNKIYNFFTSELYLKIIKNSENYKEYPITFTLKINEIDPNVSSDDELVVDGIIDLFCKADDEYYLIDYKSDVVTLEEELINRYKRQLDLYERALRKRINGRINKYLYSFHLGKFIKL